MIPFTHKLIRGELFFLIAFPTFQCKWQWDIFTAVVLLCIGYLFCMLTKAMRACLPEEQWLWSELR